MPQEPTVEVDQEVLRQALNRYLTARHGAAEPEVREARLALVHLLEDAGWQPPAAVRRALVDDEQALHRAHRRSA